MCPVLSLGLARINAVRLPMYMVRLNAVHHRHFESEVRVTAVRRHFGIIASLLSSNLLLPLEAMVSESFDSSHMFTIFPALVCVYPFVRRRL